MNHWRASKNTDSWYLYSDLLTRCLQKSPRKNVWKPQIQGIQNEGQSFLFIFFLILFFISLVMVVVLFWAREFGFFVVFFFLSPTLFFDSQVASIFQTQPNFYYHFSVASQNTVVYSALYIRHQLKFCGYLKSNLS